MNDIIKKLYIEPTSKCNLQCKMCFRNNWIDEPEGMMNHNTIENLYRCIEESRSLETAMFAGMGEPLLHGDVAGMIKKISDTGIRTELLTNGILLSPEKGEELVSAGLDFLWISVDSFEEASYGDIRRGSRFQLLMEHIAGFNRMKGDCGLGITFVMMEENSRELEHINAFADKYGVDMVHLSHVIPSLPLAKKDCIYDRNYPVGRMERFRETNRKKKRLNFCPFIDEGCCFVKWDGSVSPCMQLLHSSYTYFYEERRKVMSHSFGNINRNSLDEIWKNYEYADFRKRVREFQFPDCTLCDGCDDRLENRTDCMYNEQPTCGACLWAQEIGRCP